MPAQRGRTREGVVSGECRKRAGIEVGQECRAAFAIERAAAGTLDRLVGGEADARDELADGDIEDVVVKVKRLTGASHLVATEAQ